MSTFFFAVQHRFSKPVVAVAVAVAVVMVVVGRPVRRLSAARFDRGGFETRGGKAGEEGGHTSCSNGTSEETEEEQEKSM